eukprot:jgi/Hompol1/5683/HPOL_002024-RA
MPRTGDALASTHSKKRKDGLPSPSATTSSADGDGDGDGDGGGTNQQDNHNTEAQADSVESTQQPEQRLSIDEIPDLQLPTTKILNPPAALRIDLIDLYFAWFSPKVRLLSRQDIPSSLDPDQDQSLLHAVYAIALLSPSLPQVDSNGAAIAAFDVSRHLVVQTLQSAPETALLVFSHLSMFSSAIGRPDTLSYLSMAIQLSKSIPIDDQIGPTPSLRQEARRRAWWILFEYDIQASLFHNLPFEYSLQEIALYPLFDASIISDQTQEATRMPDQPNVVPRIPFVEPYNARSFYVWFGPLLVTLRCIIVFARSEGESPTLNPAERLLQPITLDRCDSREALGNQLFQWFTSLPPWMQIITSNYSSDIMSTNPPHWSIAYILSFYHFAQILLHKHAALLVSRHLFSDTLMSNSINTPESISLQQCILSATLISEIVRRFLMHNSLFDHVRSAITLPISAACYIHIQSLVLPNTDITKTLELIRMHFLALENLARFTHSAAADLGKLRSALQEWMDRPSPMDQMFDFPLFPSS